VVHISFLSVFVKATVREVFGHCRAVKAHTLQPDQHYSLTVIGNVRPQYVYNVREENRSTKRLRRPKTKPATTWISFRRTPIRGCRTCVVVVGGSVSTVPLIRATRRALGFRLRRLCLEIGLEEAFAKFHSVHSHPSCVTF